MTTDIKELHKMQVQIDERLMKSGDLNSWHLHQSDTSLINGMLFVSNMPYNPVYFLHNVSNNSGGKPNEDFYDTGFQHSWYLGNSAAVVGRINEALETYMLTNKIERTTEMSKQNIKDYTVSTQLRYSKWTSFQQRCFDNGFLDENGSLNSVGRELVYQALIDENAERVITQVLDSLDAIKKDKE